MQSFRQKWATLSEETQYWIRWTAYGVVAFVAYYFTTKAAMLAALREYWG